MPFSWCRFFSAGRPKRKEKDATKMSEQYRNKLKKGTWLSEYQERETSAVHKDTSIRVKT